MHNRLTRVAGCAAVIALIAGCSSGGSSGAQSGAGALNGNAPGSAGSAKATGASSGMTPQPGVLHGLYWSWTLEYVPVIDADGYSSMNAEFSYEFRFFGTNGFVWLGEPRATIEEMTCSAGQKNCEPFSVEGGTLTIGKGKPKSIEQAGTGWKIDGTTWNAIVPQAGTTLNATYTSAGCYLASCTRRSITFEPNGRYAVSGLTQSGYANDFISSFQTGTSSGEGTYAIGETSIELTPTGGQPKTAFFFRDQGDKTDTIQIADTWYDVEK
jgi:hypothetical protein